MDQISKWVIILYGANQIQRRWRVLVAARKYRLVCERNDKLVTRVNWMTGRGEDLLKTAALLIMLVNAILLVCGRRKHMLQCRSNF